MKKLVDLVKKNFDLIGYVVLAIFFIFLQINIWNNLEASIESDMSSELVLAKMLSQEHKIITTNWYYSTELKVLHNTLIFTPLFYIFDNWLTIRMVSIVILNVILFLSYLYLAKQLNIKYIPWLAFLIVGATSREYYKFVILGTHYIPDIAITFITIGMIISIFKKDNLRLFKIIFLIALSFLSSLSGIRFISALHIPLVIVAFIYCLYKQKDNLTIGKFNYKDTSIQFFVLTILCFVASFVAVACNKFVLPNLGFTYKLDEVVISYIDFSFENVSNVINGWLLNFGYQTDGLQVFSISQLIIKPLFAFYFCTMCYSTYHILRYKDRYDKYEVLITFYYVVATLILSLVFIFTSAWYRNRYLLTVSILAVYIIGIFLKRLKIEWLKFLLIIVIVLFPITNSPFQVKYHVENDGYGEFVEIKNILLKNECYNGYCDWHWNGHNLLTELSSGEIETWVFYADIDDCNEWLQQKSHLTETPKGKTFLMLQKEIYNYDINSKANDYKYYEDDEKILFIFDNRDQIKEYIIGYGYK